MPLQEAPKTDPRTAGQLTLAGVCGYIALALYATIMIGGRLKNPDGEWPSGNPLEVIIRYFRTDREWTVWHTVVVGIFAGGAVAAGFAAAELMARRSKRRTHVDGAAKHMGKGTSLNRKALERNRDARRLTLIEEVGLLIGNAVNGGAALWADWESSLLAIMGPRSGKTSSLAIRFALQAPGSVYYTSNKRDLTDAITHGRKQVGPTWVFDPQELAGWEPTWWWNPLSYIAPDKRGAETRAATMAELFTDASQDPEARSDGYFGPAAQHLMANLLLAAAVGERPITQVLLWASNPGKDTPVRILREDGRKIPAQLLEDAYNLNEETKRGVFHGCVTVLEFLGNREGVRWVEADGPDDERVQFDPDKFVRSTRSTLGCLSQEGQGSFGPMVAAFTLAITQAAENYSKTRAGGRLPVPLQVILDEAANICRIKSLPDLYSHYGSRLINILTILQSRAQGEAAWGKVGYNKLSGAATVEIVGKGVSDMDHCRELSDRCGQRRVLERSHSSSSGRSGGSATTSTSYSREPILEPADIAALPAGRSLVMCSGERPVLVELIPFWDVPELKLLVDASNAIYAPKDEGKP